MASADDHWIRDRWLLMQEQAALRPSHTMDMLIHMQYRQRQEQRPYPLPLHGFIQYKQQAVSSTSSSPISSCASDDLGCPENLSWTHTSVTDVPMDLSKPKQKVVKESFLEGLLVNGQKRKTNEEPLDLCSKRRRCDSFDQPRPRTDSLDSQSSSVTSTDSMTDMKDAVDNPVQLVELAPQTNREVTAKIHQLLIETIYKVFSLNLFYELTEGDRITLILNSWHRLLLWICAKDNFTFQVVNVRDLASGSKSSSTGQPSMAFVRTIATFIEKYRRLQIDLKELSLLFSITLFHCGQHSYCEPKKIEQYKKDLMRQLQDYIMKKPGAGAKRYTELLLYLPLLYGVNERMFETLFCKELVKDLPIKLLLTKIVKKVAGAEAKVRSNAALVNS